MKLRSYRNEDRDAVAKLFYETVHAVNANDYTQEQLFAWVASGDSLRSRHKDLLRQNTVVAETDGGIAGFGSIDASGLLDMLFVRKDCLRQGVATAICDRLEKGFPTVRTYASVTAKPFFEKRGYVICKSQEVERAGVTLRNFVMLKNAPLMR